MVWGQIVVNRAVHQFGNVQAAMSYSNPPNVGDVAIILLPVGRILVRAIMEQSI